MNKLFFTAILSLVILSFNVFAQESKTFFQAVQGRWQGTLEYQDYTSNKRVVMNTIITFKSVADGNSAEVFTIYDDFGKIYKSATQERIDTAAKKILTTRRSLLLNRAKRARLFCLEKRRTATRLSRREKPLLSQTTL
ncbi:MAG: hypothetical protein M3Q99_03385 [Acidobacteriota bacterium]|nr:hypothetical protein [Acidobacteriota bacterium]